MNKIFYQFVGLKRVQTAIALMVLLLLTGVFGYRFIAGYSWLEALYMTVITMATVGFSETQPLDDYGRLFTIFFILVSVIVLGYAISVITEYILNRYNSGKQKEIDMKNKIHNLKNHIIICGYGRNGNQAAKKLLSHNQPFVVIENNKEVVEKHEDDRILFVYGNASEDDVLEQAGIENATTLITALPDDADNLFIVLSARQINPKLNIISRASQESSYKKLKLAGADNVISPDRIGGDHMASLVVVPDLVEFIDNLNIVGKNNTNIKEVDVDELYNPTSKLKSIKDLDLRRKTGCTIIGFKNDKGGYIVNPDPELQLEANSKIIVLGKPEQIQKLESVYQLD